MVTELTENDFTSGAYSDNEFRYHIKKGFTKEEMRQILKDHKKAGDIEWLYRKVHYLQRLNKRLGEQLLDTDKRNIHIKPWHWKEICEKAKKYNEMKPEARGMIKAFNWLQTNQISKIPDHPQNIRNRELRERIEERRETAHKLWNVEIIRKEGVNPSQREFVLDVELEKLLRGEE